MSKPLRDYYIAKGYLDAMSIVWFHKVRKNRMRKNNNESKYLHFH